MDGKLIVIVKGNNVERAMRSLKRKLADDGMFRQLAERAHFEKPSDKRRRKLKAAVVRERKRNAELVSLG
jgi:small subunit ribosomal protein S21